MKILCFKQFPNIYISLDSLQKNATPAMLFSARIPPNLALIHCNDITTVLHHLAGTTSHRQVSLISPSLFLAASILVIGHDYWRRMVPGIKGSGLKVHPRPWNPTSFIRPPFNHPRCWGFRNKSQWTMKREVVQELKDCCEGKWEEEPKMWKC